MDEFDLEDESFQPLIRAVNSQTSAPLTPESPPKSGGRHGSLLSVSDHHKVALAARGELLHVIPLENDGLEPSKSVAMPSDVAHIAHSPVCPNVLLVLLRGLPASSALRFYELDALVGSSKLVELCGPVLGVDAETECVQLAVSTGSREMAVWFSMVFANGFVGLYEYNKAGFKASSTQIVHRSDSSFGAAITATTTTAGTPRATVVVVGTDAGNLVLYSNRGQRGNPLSVVSSVPVLVSGWLPRFLHHLSAYALLVTYESPKGETHNVVAYVDEDSNFVSSNGISFSHFGELCYASLDDEDGDPASMIVVNIPAWNVSFISSSRATEVELLAKGLADDDVSAKNGEEGQTSRPENKWWNWKLDDGCGVVMPSTADFDDTFPVGMDLYLGDKSPVPAASPSEPPLKPMPRLLVLTSSGVVLNYIVADDRAWDGSERDSGAVDASVEAVDSDIEGDDEAENSDCSGSFESHSGTLAETAPTGNAMTSSGFGDGDGNSFKFGAPSSVGGKLGGFGDFVGSAGGGVGTGIASGDLTVSSSRPLPTADESTIVDGPLGHSTATGQKGSSFAEVSSGSSRGLRGGFGAPVGNSFQAKPTFPAASKFPGEVQSVAAVKHEPLGDVQSDIRRLMAPDLSTATKVADKSDPLSLLKSALLEMNEELAGIERVKKRMQDNVEGYNVHISEGLTALQSRLREVRSSISERLRVQESMHEQGAQSLKDTISIGRDVEEVLVLFKSSGMKRNGKNRPLPTEVIRMDEQLDIKEAEVARALQSIEDRLERPAGLPLKGFSPRGVNGSPWQRRTSRPGGHVDASQQIFSSLSLQGARIKRVLAMIEAMESQLREHRHLLRGRSGADLGLSKARLEKLSISGVRDDRSQSPAAFSESKLSSFRNPAVAATRSRASLAGEGNSGLKRSMPRPSRMTSDMARALRDIAMQGGRERITVHPSNAGSTLLSGTVNEAPRRPKRPVQEQDPPFSFQSGLDRERVSSGRGVTASASGNARVSPAGRSDSTRRGSGGLFTSTKLVRDGGHAIVADSEPSEVVKGFGSLTPAPPAASESNSKNRISSSGRPPRFSPAKLEISTMIDARSTLIDSRSRVRHENEDSRGKTKIGQGNTSSGTNPFAGVTFGSSFSLSSTAANRKEPIASQDQPVYGGSSRPGLAGGAPPASERDSENEQGSGPKGGYFGPSSSLQGPGSVGFDGVKSSPFAASNAASMAPLDLKPDTASGFGSGAGSLPTPENRSVSRDVGSVSRKSFSTGMGGVSTEQERTVFESASPVPLARETSEKDSSGDGTIGLRNTAGDARALTSASSPDRTADGGSSERSSASDLPNPERVPSVSSFPPDGSEKDVVSQPAATPSSGTKPPAVPSAGLPPEGSEGDVPQELSVSATESKPSSSPADSSPSSATGGGGSSRGQSASAAPLLAALPPDGSEKDVVQNASLPPEGSERESVKEDTSLPSAESKKQRPSVSTTAALPPAGSEYDEVTQSAPVKDTVSSVAKASLPPPGSENDVVPPMGSPFHSFAKNSDVANEKETPALGQSRDAVSSPTGTSNVGFVAGAQSSTLQSTVESASPFGISGQSAPATTPSNGLGFGGLGLSDSASSAAGLSGNGTSGGLFGSSPFGMTTPTKPLFGGPEGSVQPSGGPTTLNPSPFGGSQAASAGSLSFGGPSSGSPFGAGFQSSSGTGTSAFGSPPNAGPSAAFGAPSSLGATGMTSNPQAHPVVSASPETSWTAPAFGAPSVLGGGFAAGAGQGGGQSAAFGQPSTIGFGAVSPPGASPFGVAANTSPPGSQFGQGPSAGFGTPSVLGMGNSQVAASGFGTPTTATFGGSQGAVNGFAAVAADGSTGGFGTPATQSSPFAAAAQSQSGQQGSPFGQVAGSGFGSFGTPGNTQSTNSFTSSSFTQRRA